MTTTTDNNPNTHTRQRWLLRITHDKGVIFRDHDSAQAQLELLQRTSVPPGAEGTVLQPITGRGRWCALAPGAEQVRRAHRTREEAEQELRQTAGLLDDVLTAETDEEADTLAAEYVAQAVIFEAGLM